MNSDTYTPSSESMASRTGNFTGGVNSAMKPMQMMPSTVPSIVSDIQTTIGNQGM